MFVDLIGDLMLIRQRRSGVSFVFLLLVSFGLFRRFCRSGIYQVGAEANQRISSNWWYSKRSTKRRFASRKLFVCFLFATTLNCVLAMFFSSGDSSLSGHSYLRFGDLTRRWLAHR